MKLSEIGEFKFIDRVSALFRDLSLPEYIGIGDDCAIIPYNEVEDYVVTTDLLIEDIHFFKDLIGPEQLGYKSLAVNLSDIAAMGARPAGSFLSIGINSDTELTYLDLFLKGYHQLSKKYHVPLLGGDTTQSGKLFIINVVVIGTCRKGEARLRSMAQNKDSICVTGNLGDSAGGLEALLRKLSQTELAKTLIRKHNLPEPHVSEGLWLAQHEGVHAMMDISDGISSDLSHILRASKKSAIVDLNTIPVSDELKEAAVSQAWDLDKLVTSGGEDYVLLCTIKDGFFEEVSMGFREAFGRNLFKIGEIVVGGTGINWVKNGKKVSFNHHGFDHFSV